jgi:hypothetical protein
MALPQWLALASANAGIGGAIPFGPGLPVISITGLISLPFSVR